MDQGPYYEAAIPILAGDVSDGWNLATTKHFPSDAVIDIILEISNETLDTVSQVFRNTLTLCLLYSIRWVIPFISTVTNSGY